jgi:hypothetical protein
MGRSTNNEARVRALLDRLGMIFYVVAGIAS